MSISLVEQFIVSLGLVYTGFIFLHIILGYLQFSPIPTPQGRLYQIESTTTIVLYLLVLIVAISPGMALHVGAPIRVEAVLLSLIVFLGINVAWALMFDDVPAADYDRA